MQDNAPPLTLESTPSKNSQAQFVTFQSVIILLAVWGVLVIGIAAAMVNPIGEYFGSRKATASKVVTLDFDRLLESGINQAVASNTAGTLDYKLAADAFQMRIAKNVQELTDRGYIIINQRALINKPKVDDITDMMISKAADPTPTNKAETGK